MAARVLADLCEQVRESGERYALRPWSESDAQTLADAWADPEIARWNPIPPTPTVEFARSWIAGTATQTEESVGIDVVLVQRDPDPLSEDVQSDVVIGEIGFQVDQTEGIAEVGFWVGARHRSKGYGRRLLRSGLALASTLGLRGVIAFVDPENRAAVGLLEGCLWTELVTTSNRRAFAVRLDGPLATD